MAAAIGMHNGPVAAGGGRVQGSVQHRANALGLRASDLAARAYGEQPERIGVTIPWVIPSSSGLASKWHRERLDWLQRLRQAIEGHAPRG